MQKKKKKNNIELSKAAWETIDGKEEQTVPSKRP